MFSQKMLIVNIMLSFVHNHPPHTPPGIGQLFRDLTNAIATCSVHSGSIFFFFFFFFLLGGGWGLGVSQRNDAVITPIARRITTVPCFYQLCYSQSCTDLGGWGLPSPEKNYKNIGFHGNTDPNPLKNL